MKITLSREYWIPWTDNEWNIMQMIKKKIYVSITQEEETEEEIKQKLEQIYNEELEKALKDNDIYTKQKKQLSFLLEELKKNLPKEKIKNIILKAKNL